MHEPTIREIRGMIMLADGSVSYFTIGTDYGWRQWGADQKRLWATVHTLESLVVGLKDAEVAVVSDTDGDDFFPQPRCDVCGIRDEEADDWCGECGCCREHCQQYESCPPLAAESATKGE